MKRIFLSVRPKLLLTFQYEIPCSSKSIRMQGIGTNTDSNLAADVNLSCKIGTNTDSSLAPSVNLSCKKNKVKINFQRKLNK